MITLHEMTHVLAFSDSLFPYFRDAAGEPRVPRAESNWPDSERFFAGQGPDMSQVVGTFKERGTTVRKIVTPQVGRWFGLRGLFGGSAGGFDTGMELGKDWMMMIRRRVVLLA
jgi:hypothetical protein